MLRQIIKHVSFVLILTLTSISAGVFWYHYMENYPWLDAFYMTVITISSVGFGEVHPISDNGKIFTIFFIIFNLIIIAYIIAVMTRFIFEGELKHIFKQYMETKELGSFKDHIIICGFGRNGRKASEVLSLNKKKFVIVEHNAEMKKNVEAKADYLFLIGNATDDDILEKAGVKTASALIATLPEDADNVFIALTARELNPKIKIISRASDESSYSKMKRAGADYVIMPDKIGGSHMANMIIRPDVMAFLDMINGEGDTQLRMEEIPFEKLSENFKNKSIKELDIRNKTGATVIGYKNSTGNTFTVNPDPNTLLGSNDKMIILGTDVEIRKFISLFEKEGV
ncbi:MAG: hypothetical protein A3H98_05265 [Bacteroidetes bacterium RIFCSPLOWO2_02_FULL_36_8]|nr:MAG: hypothetical protein A3H98_05265 [Bacteroidetes bacterium RIFCSPLOWO2_02_FULL_36_8]OFY70326.1 MAG: hypothetical protein A3G23_09325 [Bacteroidetes bacterium RIFCSPLOWO2_12_FULL_37_12]